MPQQELEGPQVFQQPSVLSSPQPQLVQPAPVAGATQMSQKESISISSIIQDNTGGISSTRVLMLCWGLGVLIVWSFAAIMSVIHGIYIFPSVPESIVTILLGVVGGKVVQRPFEK